MDYRASKLTAMFVVLSVAVAFAGTRIVFDSIKIWSDGVVDIAYREVQADVSVTTTTFEYIVFDTNGATSVRTATNIESSVAQGYHVMNLNPVQGRKLLRTTFKQAGASPSDSLFDVVKSVTVRYLSTTNYYQ